MHLPARISPIWKQVSLAVANNNNEIYLQCFFVFNILLAIWYNNEVQRPHNTVQKRAKQTKHFSVTDVPNTGSQNTKKDRNAQWKFCAQ